jgi:hypothetical protein
VFGTVVTKGKASHPSLHDHGPWSRTICIRALTPALISRGTVADTSCFCFLICKTDIMIGLSFQINNWCKSHYTVLGTQKIFKKYDKVLILTILHSHLHKYQPFNYSMFRGVWVLISKRWFCYIMCRSSAACVKSSSMQQDILHLIKL